jgi:pimeloyl-ACP methyl ester carboxylesterase
MIHNAPNAPVVRDNIAHVNGIDLFYHEADGASPPLLLLHGLSANANCWGAVIAAGFAGSHRVIAPDLRGRGRSDKPETGYAMGDHASDIVALLDSLAIQQAVVIGHSFGGYLAIYLAARFPERFTSLVVVDAALQLNPRVAELLKPSLDRLGRTSPSADTYLNEVRGAPYMNGVWDAFTESYFRAELHLNEDGTVQPATSASAIGQAMQGLAAEPWLELVGSIRQPTLVLNAVGAYGPEGFPALVGAENAQATARAFSDAKYEVVPGNHMTMMFGDGARAINQSIKAFLRTNKAA